MVFYGNLMKELDLLRLGDFLWLFVSSALFALIWNVLFVKILCKLKKGKIVLLKLVFCCFLCACCWQPQLLLRCVPFDLTNHREIFDLFSLTETQRVMQQPVWTRPEESKRMAAEMNSGDIESNETLSAIAFCQEESDHLKMLNKTKAPN